MTALKDPAWISVVVAGLALLWTGALQWQQIRLSRRQAATQQQQAELQAQMIAIEEGRDARALVESQQAKMVAWLDRREPSPVDSLGARHFQPIDEVVLVLKNKGQAPARQVGCTATAVNHEDIQIIGLETLPSTFRPCQREEFKVVVEWQTAPTLRIVLTWADDIKPDNVEDITLSYPLTRRQGQ